MNIKNSFISIILVSGLLILTTYGQEKSREEIYLEKAKDSAFERDWISVIEHLQKVVNFKEKTSDTDIILDIMSTEDKNIVKNEISAENKDTIKDTDSAKDSLSADSLSAKNKDIAKAEDFSKNNTSDKNENSVKDSTFAEDKDFIKNEMSVKDSTSIQSDTQSENIAKAENLDTDNTYTTDTLSIEDKKEAWFLLSEATNYLGQKNKAARILEYMLESEYMLGIDDYDSQVKTEIYKKLIVLYESNKNFEKAAQYIIKCIDYAKMDDDIIAQLFLEAGFNYQLSGKYEEADKIFDFGLKKVKDLALRAHLFYHKAYAKTISDEMELAKTYLKEALKSTFIEKEIEGQIYYLLGDIYESQKGYLDAYNAYTKALNLYPNKMLIQKNLAFIEKNYGKFIKLKTNDKDKANNKK